MKEILLNIAGIICGLIAAIIYINYKIKKGDISKNERNI